MSFLFPKPVPESRISYSVSDSDYEFDINEHHYKLMWERGPDYDVLIIPLLVDAFNRLSHSEKLEEIRRRHNINGNMEERDDLTELFKKLNYSDQHKLLSKFLQKFKRERLISSFKQLDAEHQQQLVESMETVDENLWDPEETEEENLRDPKETEEEFRLRRFRQLCRDHTRVVQKLTWESEDEQEDNSDWKSFFLDFSIIWFKGQWASGQDMLIEQLSKGVGGTVVIEPHLKDGQTDQAFKLRRFTGLCKKIVDFRVQEEFLDNAVRKLEMWGYGHFSYRSVLEPQEYDRAAELLSDLSTLGCNLLSAKYQRQKIEEMSNLVQGGCGLFFVWMKQVRKGCFTIEESSDDDHFRMQRFKKLFNQVPVRTRIDLFKELRKILLMEKLYSEAVRFFRGLGSEDQTEMIGKLSDKIMKYPWKKCDPAELIIEKFSDESEEDFRLRRFKKVCLKHISTCGDIIWSEADRERVRQGTSEESSPYVSFLFDTSITWFKARCANYRRNPIHVILFGGVEFCDVIEKLPEESEDEFRLRRFTESFKRLEFTFQDGIVDYIQDTLFGDLGHPVSYCIPLSSRPPTEGMGEFDSEWIITESKRQGAATTTQGAAATTQGAAAITQGATTTTQAGGGRGQQGCQCVIS